MDTENKSIEQELADKCVIPILISLEAQLNALPPNGSKKMSHGRENVISCISSQIEMITEDYPKITFRKLRKKDKELYEDVISKVDCAVFKYHCVA